MPFGGLGMWEILLILLVLLLVFGAKRLPELGGALGKGIREFKGSVRDIERELTVPSDAKSTRELNKGSSPAQSAPAQSADKAQAQTAEPSQAQSKS